MRRTKIVCTLGPATATRERVTALAKAGMNVARLNFSHGTTESQRAMIRMIHDINAAEGLEIAVLLDTKGAEIRSAQVEQPIEVHEGQDVLFASAPLPDAQEPVIVANYPDIANDAAGTTQVLVDNGELIFEILSIDGGIVRTRAVSSGAVGSRRHINLPGANVSLPSVTDKDWEDIAAGCGEGIDFIALSFIRNGDDVRQVRQYIADKDAAVRLIAKIETAQAVENFDDILHASDGVMVARGDLGAELPFERIPAIQDDLVKRCRAAGKPVIVATHMLESMIKSPLPTRAEVTDVAHAAMSRADATMLSGETANGAYPLRALQVMDRVLSETETHADIPSSPPGLSPFPEHDGTAAAAVVMADTLDAPMVFLLTATLPLAHAVSFLRPSFPVIACSADLSICRKMQLLYGIVPLPIPESDGDEEALQHAFDAAKEAGHVQTGQEAVVVFSAHDDAAVQIRTIT